jgi:hypothetical protein
MVSNLIPTTTKDPLQKMTVQVIAVSSKVYSLVIFAIFNRKGVRENENRKVENT